MTVLIKEINIHASQNGYAVAKNGTINNRITYRYVKGHQPKSKARPEVHESKRRKTST